MSDPEVGVIYEKDGDLFAVTHTITTSDADGTHRTSVIFDEPVVVDDDTTLHITHRETIRYD